MFDVCKTKFYLERKHYNAAVLVWRVKAVEVTILLYAMRWRSISSRSAGILLF